MKSRFYLKNGNELVFNSNAKIVFLNLKDFYNDYIKRLTSITFNEDVILRYILYFNNIEFSGEFNFELTRGPVIRLYCTNPIKEYFCKDGSEIKCHIKIELGATNIMHDDKYIVFTFIDETQEQTIYIDDMNSPEFKKASEILDDKTFELLEIPTIKFKYGEIKFFNKDSIDEMQEKYRKYIGKYNPDKEFIHERADELSYAELNNKFMKGICFWIGYDTTDGVDKKLYFLRTDDSISQIYCLSTNSDGQKVVKQICDKLVNFNSIMKILEEYKSYFYESNLSIDMKNDIYYNKISTINFTCYPVSNYYNTLLNNAISNKTANVFANNLSDSQEIVTMKSQLFEIFKGSENEQKINDLSECIAVFKEFYSIVMSNKFLPVHSMNLKDCVINISNPVSYKGITIYNYKYNQGDKKLLDAYLDFAYVIKNDLYKNIDNNKTLDIWNLRGQRIMY